MGEVYRARDSKLGRDVALKVLPAEFARDAERVVRLKREARVLASLNHPNIAAIYGLEEAEDVCALAMELVEGPTLAARIGKRAMAQEKALPIAKQIVEALEYAHERGIVHRDLKPANVKLTAEGTAKLLDFGLAKTLEGAIGSPAETVEGTRSGAVMGTAAYMSPEQAQGKAVDRRTDIWAFGVVLYEMLTGKQVFQGESTAEVLAAVLKEEPKLDELPAGVRKVVARCLRKDPHDRWHSIGDVQIALEEAAQTTAYPAEQRTLRRLRRALGFGLAALLVSVCALSLWLWRRHSPVTSLPSIIPITTDIGWPNFPSFSPDGREVAYSWQPADSSTSSIYVKLIGSETELRVTSPPGWDVVPAWSPDGRWIAFYRSRIAHPGYYLVSALGGPVRQLLGATVPPQQITVAEGISWFPDS